MYLYLGFSKSMSIQIYYSKNIVFIFADTFFYYEYDIQ